MNNTQQFVQQAPYSLRHAIVLFCILLISSCTSEKSVHTSSLSNHEKNWLEHHAHQIVVPFGYSAPPNAFYNEHGEYVGLLIDYKKEIEKEIETPLKNKYLNTWSELIDYTKQNDNFVVVGIARTQEREKYLRFTNSFIKIPYIIITHKDSEIESMSDISTEEVCYPRSYAVGEYLALNHGNLKVIEVNNELDALKAVSSGRYKVAIISQMDATYLIDKEGYTNLRIAGESGYINRLAAAVSINNPELFKIVDKAVDQISPETQNKIYDKWIYQMPEKVSMTIVYAILIISGLTVFVVFILWLWLGYLRKQVAKATHIIRQNEERYRSLVENSNDAIYILQKYRFVLVNKKFEDLFEYSQEEIIDNDFDFINLVAPESKEFIRKRNEHILSNKEVPHNYEFMGLTKSGKILYLEVSVNFLNQDNGIATQGIIHDITDRKTKEIELLNAKERAEESDRLKSAFLANMSHEIRTPMNGILGFTELLKSPKYSPQQQDNFIEIIKKSGDRMLATINNIIDISKIESGVETVQMNKVNIRNLINELYSFFLPEVNQRGIQLILDFPSYYSKDEILTDEYKLNSILTNLIKNAIKFTPKGSITIGYSFTADQIHLKVVDTGRGIPKEKQASVFDYFVQADVSTTRGYEGSGLGLSITKGYVNMLSGNIHIESEIDIGTSFFIDLPIHEQSNEPKEVPVLPVETTIPKSADLKIIVAEDDEISAQLLGLMLSEISNKILFARNGIETVELFKKHPDTDIILLDMKMPELGGLEVTKQIREFNNEVFIIAQTAFAKDGYSEKTINSGCNEFLLKPVEKSKLHEIIYNHFS